VRQTFHLQNMRLTNLNPSKYKRFFAFGCSFTKYSWPTWADIIGQDVPVYQNWATPGAGNHYIFNSIMEADARYKFNNNDLVIVMWSCKEREDRYSNNKWLSDTNLSQEKTYGKKWVKNFGTDLRGFLIRDLGYIAGAQSTIQKASWEQFCLNPLTNIDDTKAVLDGVDLDSITEEIGREYWIKAFDKLCTGSDIDPYLDNADVIETYKDLFLNINKSLEGRWTFEYVKNRVAPNNDNHPTPLEALEFLNNVWPGNSLSIEAQNHARQWNVNHSLITRL